MAEFLLSLLIDGAVYLWNLIEDEWYWKVVFVSIPLLIGLFLCALVFGGT
jgi:hypothetical protein